MNKNKILIGLAFLLLGIFSSLKSALPYSFSWKFAGWSGGGAFPYIYADPSLSGTVWVISDVSGIYKSTDRGDTWNSSSSGLRNVGGSTIIQAPSDPAVFYHASGRSTYGGAVHKSSDGGKTWSNQGVGSQFRVDIDGHKALAINRSNANIAYLGNDTGDIYRTTNGSTWSLWIQSSALGLGKIHAMAVDQSNTYLWVGSSSGLRRVSLADGSVISFTLSAVNPSQNRDIASLKIAGTGYLFVAAGDRVAYTTNNGLSWAYTSSTAIASDSCISRIAVAPGADFKSTRIMVAYTTINFSYSGGLKKSSDGGANWASGYGNIQQATNDNPTRIWHAKSPGEIVLTLAVDPFDSNRWWVGDFWGIFRTDDFGQNWAEKIKNAGNSVVSDIKIAPNGDIFAASMDNGLLKSTDGINWQMCIPNTVSGQNYPDVSGHVWKIVTTGTAADWAAGKGHVIATDSPWDSSSQNKILRSTDNGKTWSIITGTGIPNTIMYSGIWGTGYPRSIDYTAGKILVGLDGYNGNTNGGVFESLDDGINWTRKTANPQPTTNWGNDWKIYNGLARNPINAQNIIYGTFSGSGIKYSLDGGSSWQSPVSGNQYYIYDLKIGSNGNAFACGIVSDTPALFRSTDYGVTWKQIWTGPSGYGCADALEIDPRNPKRLVVSTTTYNAESPNMVYMTEDADAPSPTFTDITGDLATGQGFTTCAFRSTEGSAGCLYCGRSGGGIFKADLQSSSGSTILPPTNLTSTAETGGIRLQWTASLSTSVTGYNVYRDGTLLSSCTSTSQLDDTVVKGQTYTYKVAAYDANKNLSDYSNSISVTLPSDLLPPSNLTAQIVPSGVFLQWTASASSTVQGYNVDRSGGNLVYISSSQTTDQLDNTVIKGQAYTYKVQAYDASNNVSPYSNSVTVTVPGGLAAPTNLTATSETGGVRIKWTASTSSAVTGYDVYRNGAYYKSYATTNQLDNTVVKGVTYTYTVKAYDNSGNFSDFSNSVTITVAGLAAPTNLTATNETGGIRLIWTASTSPSATGYNVYRNGVYYKSYATTNQLDSAVVKGRSYTYYVRAYDAYNNRSDNSNSVTIIR